MGSAPDCSIFAGKKSEDDLGIHCTENCTAPMDADGSAATDGVITTNDTDITSITALLQAGFHMQMSKALNYGGAHIHYEVKLKVDSNFYCLVQKS